jgi:hypothetical protein
MTLTRSLCCALAVFASTISTATLAAPTSITVTAQNTSAPNGIAFAPLRIGFGSGVFDAFNLGQAATAPIISVAEGGSGSAWFPAFNAAEPTAVTGTVGGLLLSGQTASATFSVDNLLNQFFTFAAMVVPSNDLFIGNDDPTEYRLFDAAGNLRLSSISVFASEIWDAGSEQLDPANAAFVQGGDNDRRTPQNSVVSFNFGELAAFNGLTTGAGYTFNSNLSANQEVFRITFSQAQVPLPGGMALVLAGLVPLLGLRGRKLVQTGKLAE